MAYVATRGGEEAIRRAEALYRNLNGQPDGAFVRALGRHLPYLVDRVMGEGSLYAPDLAALAIAQAGGDLYEAVLLLRAYRSTLPRVAYAEPLEREDMLVVRRISAAFKDIPGGQLLGPTLDYSQRILHMGLLEEADVPAPEAPAPADGPAPACCPSVSSWQRLSGLLGGSSPVADRRDPADLPDVTREPITFPASREHRLQSLSRADTGGLLAIGYASMRGYGLTHPTVNEVLLGHAEVRLRHPVTGLPFSVGRVRVSQCEVVDTADDRLELGFSATLGWNEVKTISAAMLDMEMDKDSAARAAQSPFSDEFVLYHTEPVEASGFCIHYKLPHYVTFSSGLDAIRKVRKGDGARGGRLRKRQEIVREAGRRTT